MAFTGSDTVNIKAPGAKASQVELAWAQNSPKPASARPNLGGSLLDASSWSEHTLLFEAGDTGAATVYWPWVVKTDKIASPLDAYYMYYSTDHDTGNGGIHMSHGPSPVGPWTYHGQVYVDLATGLTGQGQTETPSVMWDDFSSIYRMFYQQIVARYGAGDATAAVGVQSTLSATSTDGITWTKDPNFILQIPSGNKLYGDGHTGYFLPFRTARGLFGYSLLGSGNFGVCTQWRCRGKSDDWATDYKSLPYSYALTQGSPINGRKTEWNHSFVLESGGVEYWIGRLSDGASGASGADCLIGIAPISPDYKQLLGRPVAIWSPVEVWESADMRSVTPYIEGGVLYVYYTIAKTHIGVISHVL